MDRLINTLGIQTSQETPSTTGNVAISIPGQLVQLIEKYDVTVTN